MKLRIHGNSLRLRISESDLARLRWEGRMEGWMGLGPGRRFTYALEGSDEVERLTALFESDALTVLMPRTWLDGWSSDEDGTRFESMQPIDGEQELHITVEKDLPCRHDGRNKVTEDETKA